MEAQLLERAQRVAELANGNKLREADFKEIGEVYYLLTGKRVSCVSCNVYTLLNEIRNKSIQQPKDFNTMAKYQFKPAHRGVKVIRHMENGVTKVITSENLNKSDNAEFLASSKEYAHLIEETKASKEGEESQGEGEAKPAARTAKK